MAILIDGKAVAARKMEELKFRVDTLKKKGRYPSLRIIQIGDDPASDVYIRQKIKACKGLNIECYHDYINPDNYKKTFITDYIASKGLANQYSGTILQLPVPDFLNGAEMKIAPQHDVDGLSTQNAGLLFQNGDVGFIPCTAKGIIELLKAYNIPLSGKHAVIVGRSNIVGKPLAMLLLGEDCTVTICHSKTQFLNTYTREADILVSATGKPGLITKDMVKRGAAVIDVGIMRGEDGKLHGDVDFESVEPIAGWITPVPGGVGPMTVTMLMENVILAEERRATDD